MQRDGIETGLGDRIGNYLIFAMLGEIYNKDIYTTWITKNDPNNIHSRGSQYPNNIFEYIQFPKRLKFVSKEEYSKLNYPYLRYKWVYHGLEQVPETIYKNLYEDGHIKCSYRVMLIVYRNVCKELYYKKELPPIYKERPCIIHLRRGDKGSNDRHNQRIVNVYNKYKNDHPNWVITTDGNIPQIIRDNIPNIIIPEFSTDNRVRTLEEFFLYSHAKIILQSIVEPGKYGGWSGFSYIPFLLGLSLYENKELLHQYNQPLLISMSDDKENTILTYMKEYAERNLYNVIMYNNLNNNLKYYTIYGERCSGTNYLENLMNLNFDIKLTTKYGKKHFFGFNEELNKSGDTLFICIVRDLKQWLNSFYKKPHKLIDINCHSVQNFLNNEIVSHKLNSISLNGFEDQGNELLTDRNIYTGKRYKNIFELRHTKIKYMLDDLPYKVNNYIFIKYEDLIDDFDNTMNKIKNKGLNLNNINFPVNTTQYKKTGSIFKKKEYNIITDKHILNNPNIMKYYEQKLGYI